MTYGKEQTNSMSDHAGRLKNSTRTCEPRDTALTQPRTLSDLRSFLHGYRIKSAGYPSLTARASIIVTAIDELGTEPSDWISPTLRRAARELADLDPSLSWLPTWKPRERVAAQRS